MRLRILTLLVFTALLRSCPGDKKAKCAQVDCLMRYISLPMIKDMSKTLKTINKSLQSENRRHVRYLPKLYIKKMNIADISKILEIYEDYIFRKLWTSDTDGPRRFIHSFRTLKDNVESCKHRGPATFSNHARKKIKEMEQDYQKLETEEILNALRDFEMVLHWISVYIDKKLSHRKCQMSSSN
ncbi:interleukin-26 [Brachyhypopomus gauderio]|uniref:interleukin-26 n=1 Tax=Brachyhypopomus gauderio TaxID=698409 RepID=UPI004042538F